MFTKKQKIDYDSWKLSYPPEWDRADAEEEYIEKAAPKHEEAIWESVTELAEVIRVSDPEDFLNLVKTLHDLVEGQIPQYQLEYAQKVKMALKELVSNAAEQAAWEDLKCQK